MNREALRNEAQPLLVAATGDARPRESLAVRIADTMLEWLDRARARHSLSEMTEGELRDIGFSRAQIEFEAGKPFWRA